MRRVANTDFLIDSGTALYKVVGGSFTELGSWGTTYTTGDYVSLYIVGNVVTRKVWIGDPLAGGVLRNTASITLTGTNATDFGAGVEKYGAIWANASGNKGDNLRVENRGGELRRLVADINHPSGGVISTVIASS
jgi:hypothetical protein